jgi:hypothetical protein
MEVIGKSSTNGICRICASSLCEMTLFLGGQKGKILPSRIFRQCDELEKSYRFVASFSEPRSPTEHPDFLESTDLQVPSDPTQQHRTERYGTRRALLVRFARVSVCHRLQSRGHGQQTGNHEQLAEKSKNMRGCIRIYNIYILCYMY